MVNFAKTVFYQFFKDRDSNLVPLIEALFLPSLIWTILFNIHQIFLRVTGIQEIQGY